MDHLLTIVSICVGVVTLATVLIRTGAVLQWMKDHEVRDNERFVEAHKRMDRIEGHV